MHVSITYKVLFTDIIIEIKVHKLIKTIEIVLLATSPQDPHAYFYEFEKDPSPLMLYKSHCSHNAPMCPT